MSSSTAAAGSSGGSAESGDSYTGQEEAEAVKLDQARLLVGAWIVDNNDRRTALSVLDLSSRLCDAVCTVAAAATPGDLEMIMEIGRLLPMMPLMGAMDFEVYRTQLVEVSRQVALEVARAHAALAHRLAASKKRKKPTSDDDSDDDAEADDEWKYDGEVDEDGEPLGTERPCFTSKRRRKGKAKKASYKVCFPCSCLLVSICTCGKIFVRVHLYFSESF